MNTFVVLKILSYLAMPPASLAVGTVVGLVLLAVGWRRLGWAAILAASLCTVFMSWPPLGDTLLRYVEDQARAAERATPRCCFDAIVVLGGGIAPAVPPEREFPSLTESADRVWAAARLYKAGVAPRIIVSGGGFLAGKGPATTEAEAMRRFLVELGIPETAIVDEDKSNNTVENIYNVRKMVGDKPVALVTSGFHMPRAMRIAAGAGLNVSAFPTNFHALRSTRPPWENWLPTIEGMGETTLALHEIFGILFDKRTGSTQ
ncbi:MAG: YdcF family protein [Proteobacteria bacterium]|nr:YdcF family protein [Pseudomonadota bacterium]